MNKTSVRAIMLKACLKYGDWSAGMCLRHIGCWNARITPWGYLEENDSQEIGILATAKFPPLFRLQVPLSFFLYLPHIPKRFEFPLIPIGFSLSPLSSPFHSTAPMAWGVHEFHWPGNYFQLPLTNVSVICFQCSHLIEDIFQRSSHWGIPSTSTSPSASQSPWTAWWNGWRKARQWYIHLKGDWRLMTSVIWALPPPPSRFRSEEVTTRRRE